MLLYKTLIIPVLKYGAESWTMTKADESTLGRFERKVLRVIYGPVCIEGEWRKIWNDELYGLYSDVDLARRSKIQRLRWLCYVERMKTNAWARKVFESTPTRQCSRGRPRIRWSVQVESDLTQLGA